MPRGCKEIELIHELVLASEGYLLFKGKLIESCEFEAMNDEYEGLFATRNLS